MPVEIVDRLAHELALETARVSADVDRFFGDLLTPSGDSRDQLYQAMRHAAIGGGKRLRPLLTTAAARLFAIGGDRALRLACAIDAGPGRPAPSTIVDVTGEEPRLLREGAIAWDAVRQFLA